MGDVKNDGESELHAVARLYYTGTGSRRYRRASVQNGPGEPLCFLSVAQYKLRQRDARIAELESKLAAKETPNG